MRSLRERADVSMGTDHRAAFTLLELLIVISIIALLMSILLPALSAGRHAATDLKCKANLRSVDLQFLLFAGEDGAGHRGDSDQLGPNLFRLEDFQESIYGISEFWIDPQTDRMPLSGSRQLLMCPAGPSKLESRSGMPCSAGAIGPQENVSVGFNKRLETRTRYIDGTAFPAPAYLSDKILQFPDVPLLFDVDGEQAGLQKRTPYYSAPPVPDDSTSDIYESGRWWFPAFRHRGRINVGFVGGHVLSSSHPTTEPWWRWNYQPD
jgi:prepilin-type N-terminal cleavage/methylation domain-containing protein/prepilin-type processing-associated H-X9-DG protein